MSSEFMSYSWTLSGVSVLGMQGIWLSSLGAEMERGFSGRILHGQRRTGSKAETSCPSEGAMAQPRKHPWEAPRVRPRQCLQVHTLSTSLYLLCVCFCSCWCCGNWTWIFMVFYGMSGCALNTEVFLQGPAFLNIYFAKKVFLKLNHTRLTY